MAVSLEYGDSASLRFSLAELTGALGDSVTVLPIVVAVAALSPLSLPHLLLGFAAFQVVWGLHYGLPVSVEPMKALAALLLAGGLTAGELAVAGLVAGAVLLVVGRTGTLARVERHVGQPVIRGVQVAVALLLLETGVRLASADVGLAIVGTAVAGLAAIAGYRRSIALAVLLAGLAISVSRVGVPAASLPAVGVALPAPAALSGAALEGAVAQFAMTVGNAAIATSVLLADYYDADVSADQLASSMGAMNLLAVPLGAMPMCHGSGGVAGKYAFGARTAGANLLLGGLYAAAALVGVGLVAAFPVSMLGVVLALVAVELGRAGLDTDHLPLTLAVGLLGVVTNVGVAFVAGTVGFLLLEQR